MRCICWQRLLSLLLSCVSCAYGMWCKMFFNCCFCWIVFGGCFRVYFCVPLSSCPGEITDSRVWSDTTPSSPGVWQRMRLQKFCERFPTSPPHPRNCIVVFCNLVFIIWFGCVDNHNHWRHDYSQCLVLTEAYAYSKMMVGIEPTNSDSAQAKIVINYDKW